MKNWKTLLYLAAVLSFLLIPLLASVCCAQSGGSYGSAYSYGYAYVGPPVIVSAPTPAYSYGSQGGGGYAYSAPRYNYGSQGGGGYSSAYGSQGGGGYGYSYAPTPSYSAPPAYSGGGYYSSYGPPASGGRYCINGVCY